VRPVTPGARRLDAFMNRDPRWALSMNETAQHETPQLGIFWLAQASNGDVRLLAAGCPLDQAEPYGDCLTYGRATTKHGRPGAATGRLTPPFAPWCGRWNTKTGRADA
jgi:hypothetical protein